MGERLDKALALFARFVGAIERIADAAADTPQEKPAKKARRKLSEPTAVDRERAARVAKKLGMVAKR